MVSDKVGVRGSVKIETIDNGVVIKSMTTNNMIMDTGLEKLASLFVGDMKFESIAVGTGTTPPQPDDRGVQIRAADSRQVASGFSGNVTTASVDIEMRNDYGLTEATLEIIGRVLFSRSTFEVYPVIENQTIRVTWTIEFNA